MFEHENRCQGIYEQALTVVPPGTPPLKAQVVSRRKGCAWALKLCVFRLNVGALTPTEGSVKGYAMYKIYYYGGP